MALRKVCPQHRPYSNCVTLSGVLSNWTSEDIVDVATKNVETIIAPIRDDLAEQTVWKDIDASSDLTDGSDGVLEFGSIGDSLDGKDDDYEWEIL